MATYEKNYFRIALLHLLEEQGRGADTSVAISAGLSAAQFSRIKTGRSAGSVQALESIAKALGMSYKEMLILGEELASNGDGSSVKEKKREYNSDLTDKIVKMVEQLDRMGADESLKSVFSNAKGQLDYQKIAARLAEVEQALKKAL